MKLKNIIKRAVAAAATICLAASPVLAAVPIGNQGYVASEETTLTIPKGVTMFNEVTGTYYHPDINYTYTIAPATPPTGATAKTGTGETAAEAEVHAGIADAVTISSVPQFATGAKEMTAAGTEYTQNLNITVDTTKFAKPGIYRYLITDTTPLADLFAAGVTRTADYQTTRYLDVYIERDTDTTYKVAGYVLIKNNPALNDNGNIQKSVGYIASDGLGNDSYHTYNVRLAKDVQGTMGDRTHSFPFAVTVNNNSLTYLWAKNETDNTNFASTALTSSTLKHNDYIIIRGLNPHATVAYTETNDVDDIYRVRVTGDGTVLVAEAPKQLNETAVLAASAVTDYDAENTSSDIDHVGVLTNVKDVVYVNTMNAVSPTGVVTRFAPYLLILGAAIVLLVMKKVNFANEK